jgi:hypothetical protein
VLLCALDNGLTFYGQPPEYWSGDYGRCRESHPILRWCLELHPAAAVAEAILWAAAFVALIVFCPWRIARLISLGVALGHVVGSSTWIANTFGLYWLYPPVLLGSAWLIAWTWGRAEARRPGKAA